MFGKSGYFHRFIRTPNKQRLNTSPGQVREKDHYCISSHHYQQPLGIKQMVPVPYSKDDKVKKNYFEEFSMSHSMSYLLEFLKKYLILLNT